MAWVAGVGWAMFLLMVVTSHLAHNEREEILKELDACLKALEGKK